jgi:peptidylprolyl isomerase
MKQWRRTLAAVLLLPFCSATVMAEDAPAPEFIAGDWCAVQGEQQFEERWTGAEGGRMYAVARSFKSGRLTGFEFLRIEPEGQSWVYRAQPGGQTATGFPRTEAADQRIVFSNPDHDFPQRIEYWRDASGLHAAVSALDPAEGRLQFDFRAGRCQMGMAKTAEAALTMAEVLDASKPSDWRRPDPGVTLYLELESGRVVIELASDFAPRHVANILKLARSGYYDGLAILRVQDNFVVQWGDPKAEDEAERKRLTAGERQLAAEFTRSAGPDLPFTLLPDGDGYATQTGFVAGFPAARDPQSQRAWLTHCYGTLGVGRDNDVNSGGGTELYVVIGHAPRQLDRNITVAGRVIQGMELLSSLPRGPVPMGFYEQPEQHIAIRKMRVAADVPEAERSRIELLRTDTPRFQDLIEARRNRRDEWYKQPAGHIDVCSVPLPARAY